MKIFIVLFLFSSGLCAQDFRDLKLFQEFNEKEKITSNIKLSDDSILLSVYWKHGFMDLTEIRHYIVSKNWEVKKIEESQSKGNTDMIYFKETTMSDVEKSAFLIHFKKLLNSDFIQVEPAAFIAFNPKVQIQCMLDSDKETRGIIVTQNKKQSKYEAYNPHQILQSCDLIHKEYLQEFVDLYSLFRFELKKFY